MKLNEITVLEIDGNIYKKGYTISFTLNTESDTFKYYLNTFLSKDENMDETDINYIVNNMKEYELGVTLLGWYENSLLIRNEYSEVMEIPTKDIIKLF